MELFGVHVRIPTFLGMTIGGFRVNGLAIAIDERLAGKDWTSAGGTGQFNGNIILSEKHGSLHVCDGIRTLEQKRRGDGNHAGK